MNIRQVFFYFLPVIKYRKTPHLVPRRIELFFCFWALRPGYYVQQWFFFSTISGSFSHNLDRDIGTETTKNVKILNKSSQKLLKIDF
jgi:hypothetical protein